MELSFVYCPDIVSKITEDGGRRIVDTFFRVINVI